MIYYLVNERNTRALQNWIEYYGVLRGRIRVLPYSRCHGSLEPGTFVFSDVERLSPRQTRRATRLWAKAREAGCRTLNHPSRSLRRYGLQKALKNDFRVFRKHEVPEDVRFPVFLRGENDHKGNLTRLLESPQQLAKVRKKLPYALLVELLDTRLLKSRRRLARARRKLPGALLVEFLDTSDEEGTFRKYSAMRIGDRIIPRHILFSQKWVVKDPDRVTGATVEEELDYFERNPHEAELRQIFDTARMDYGRIDYSLYEGRIQTWEINSNPTLTSPSRAPSPERYQQRAELGETTAAAINEALLALEAGNSTGEKLRLGFPRTLRPESRFAI